jgi:cytochrome c oxidase cbb3-type subunit IV
MMSYDSVATVSQVTSLLMFIGMFAAVLAYAFRPSNGARFERAQRAALELDRSQTENTAP